MPFFAEKKYTFGLAAGVWLDTIEDVMADHAGVLNLSLAKMRWYGVVVEARCILCCGHTLILHSWVIKTL